MIPLNHQFFSGLFLILVCMAISMAGTLTDDWSTGSALIGGSEYYSDVRLGLWYGTQRASAARPESTFYYMWCEAGTPAYHGGNCFSLTAARVGACLGVCLMLAALVVVALLGTFVVKLRLEPTMARVSAVFTGAAFLCFLLCVALWAHLILTLSHATPSGGGGSKTAALSIGLSWLAECGGCLLAFLTTLNLALAARRIDREVAEIGANNNNNRRSHGVRRSGGVGGSPAVQVQPQPHASKAAPV